MRIEEGVLSASTWAGLFVVLLFIIAPHPISSELGNRCTFFMRKSFQISSVATNKFRQLKSSYFFFGLPNIYSCIEKKNKTNKKSFFLFFLIFMKFGTMRDTFFFSSRTSLKHSKTGLILF